MISWFSYLRHSLVLVLVLSALTGGVYPLVVTVAVQLAASQQAKGRLVQTEGVTKGAYDVGQYFYDPAYFWGRPSATSGHSYNAMASGGSNLAAGNPVLESQVAERVEKLKKLDPENTLPVPVDLVTSSASGLDPHISPAAASYQLARVARIRGVEPQQIRMLIDNHTEKKFLGVFGEKRVHVLSLNLALDRLKAE